MQKAANDADECKQMLVNMQRQLDRMEEKQDEMVRDGRLKGSLLDFSSDEEEDEEEEERSPGGRSKLALVAMAGGAILIGGALAEHQLR